MLHAQMHQDVRGVGRGAAPRHRAELTHRCSWILKYRLKLFPHSVYLSTSLLYLKTREIQTDQITAILAISFNSLV